MMTKIEFWRKVKENCENGNWGCMDVRCKNCPIIEDSDICKIAKNSCETEQALALAEAYIKRHEQESKKKVEPKPVKTVGIDNGDVVLARPTVKENLSVPCKPLASGMCSNPFDHCEEDCPANSEYPQPIKLPDFVYSASKSGVEFIDTKNRTFNTNDKGELLINDKPCFTTPEEALQVAKKLWQGEGK
jgi:hypothetical protein